MWLGTFQLGDTVDVRVQTKTGALVPTNPDAAPTYKIYKDADSSTTATGSLPIQDKWGTTGVFLGNVFLDSAFSAGTFCVLVQWAISSTAGSEILTFEIVSGGDARGEVISLYPYSKRDSEFLVWQTNSGHLVTGRGPMA